MNWKLLLISFFLKSVTVEDLLGHGSILDFYHSQEHLFIDGDEEAGNVSI